MMAAFNSPAVSSGSQAPQPGRIEYQSALVFRLSRGFAYPGLAFLAPATSHGHSKVVPHLPRNGGLPQGERVGCMVQDGAEKPASEATERRREEAEQQRRRNEDQRVT